MWRPRALALAALIGGASLAGCFGGRGVARLDEQVRAYRAGEPAFALDAVATVDDEATGLDVYLSLPRASLIYRQTGGSFEGIAQWTVTVEREGQVPITLEPVDTVRVATAEATRSAEPVQRVERVDVPPGRYTVRAAVEDLASGRTAERRAEVLVTAPTGAPSLGGLRLEGRLANGEVGPLVATSLPAGVDSLQAVAQAIAPPDSAVVEVVVVRFPTDTTAAEPMWAFNPVRLGLVGRGVDLGRPDTVQAVRQPLLNPAEAVRVEAPLPALDPGLYRVSLAVLAPEAEAAVAEANRLVVVRRRDYPLVTRLGDLVEPLVYLAEPGEVEALRAFEGGPGLRAAFDRFWGDRLDDRRVASSTVRTYYERVEEANRLFATQKEGWKTDQGMVYVLFGPPSYVETTPTREVWTYGMSGVAPQTLVFERTAGFPGDRAPFSVLSLVRDRGYQDVWSRIRYLWRTGQVS